MKYLVLGSNGMAGHTIYLYLKNKGHEVVGFSRSNPYHFESIITGDVTDFDLLKTHIDSSKFDAIINAVGLLNNDAENNLPNAILVNAYLPHFLEGISKNSQTKIIHISTDCVFSGKKGNYLENDLKDGSKWYDRTKALGEIENSKDLTIRTSIIGPELKNNGIGLMHWFLTQKDQEIYGYQNVFWSGVTTLYLAKAIEYFSQKNTSGIYHLVNNEKINKFDLLNLMNDLLLDIPKIIKPKDDPKIDKSLINTRDEGIVVPSYQAMIQSVRDWIEQNSELYPHYIQRTIL